MAKEIDLDELKKCDGKEGRPAYIAHLGKIYDVTQSKLWKNGRHMNRHNAGNDLTHDIQAAPHTLEVLDRYPEVGTLKEKPVERKLPPALERILSRVPMLRRHPHPMTVHFPISFTLAVPAFVLLYLVTGIRSFEVTALHCLGAAIFFTPITMATGFYTWWLNYFAKWVHPVVMKQILSFLLLPLEVLLFVWRIQNPEILSNLDLWGVIYLLLVICLFALTTAIGWFGAKLTFPTE
ncbi:MAG: cytochrome b5 [Deltaproteobacteria bacterium HGW-Deltaproteobacteria-21]|nr:MAG: cytochrome b5 [Deltaproteobacteria bacterium HGW-Deltaproteobacteria-21]